MLREGIPWGELQIQPRLDHFRECGGLVVLDLDKRGFSGGLRRPNSDLLQR